VKLAAVAVVGAAVVAGGGFLKLPRATPAGDQAYYGHIRSLTKSGSRYELGFDPAWLLTGATASRAKLADTGSDDVANDTYTRDESHRLLTFLAPAGLRPTVLTNQGTRGIAATPISMAELAQIVKGRRTRHRLFEPLDSGIWIRVHVDTLTALDQQYKP
jgi:hypothetical protein